MQTRVEASKRTRSGRVAVSSHAARKPASLKKRAEAAGRISVAFIFLLNALAPVGALAAPADEGAAPVPAAAARELPRLEPVFYEPPARAEPQEVSPEPDEPPPVVPPRDEIEFYVVPTSPTVGANGLVTLQVTLGNNGEQTYQELTFVDILETGLEYSPDASSPVAYDGQLRAVTYSITSLAPGDEISFSYRIQLTAGKRSSLLGRAWLHRVSLLDGESVNLTAEVTVGVEIPVTVEDSAIAALQTDEWNELGRISVQIGTETIGRDAFLVVSPVTEQEDGPPLQFQLNLYEASEIVEDGTGAPAEQTVNLEAEITGRFDEPAFLEINLDEFVDLTDIPAGQEPYVATYDEAAEVWVKVPILEEDLEGNSVTVQAAHFSTWGAGLGNSLPQNGANVLLFDQPYTSLFTGSSRYSIPIWTPPGRAGMSPDISLAYSSGALDGVLGDVQGSWVGAGWNIDGVEIVRKITTNENGYGYINEFALTLNGTLYELVQDTEHPSRYFTKTDAFLYVERHNFALGNANPTGTTQVPPNETGEWWEVVTHDGTRYRLGWNADSEQLALMYGYACTVGGATCATPDGAYASLGYAGRAQDLVALRWRVDRVTDTHGNYMAYSYVETQPDPATQVAAFDRDSYLQEIAFTGFEEPGPGSSNDLDPAYYVEFEYGERSSIGDVPTTFQIWDNLDEKYLDGIEICYGECGETGSVTVRAYNLDYTLASVPNANGTLTLTSIAMTAGNYSDPVSEQYVAAVTAPTIKFTYQNLANRASGAGDVFAYPRLATIENGAGGKLTYTYEHDGRANDSWYNYRVNQVRVENGLGTAALQSYAYTTPVYAGQGGNPSLGALFGYTTTTETQLDYDNGNAALLATKHVFGTVGLDIGREVQTEWLEGSTVHRKVRNVYVTDNSAAPFLGWNNRYLSQSLNYIRSGGSVVLVSQTRFLRDPATGNLLVQSDYLGAALYRKTYYEYLVNTNPAYNIVDKVSRVLLVTADNAIVSDTRYHYDGMLNLAPTRGDLTLTQKLTGPGSQTVDTRIEYDVYGNAVHTYAHVGYGTANTGPSSNAIESSTVYDDLNYMFPVASTNPMGLGWTSEADYIHALGIPYRTEDVNGWPTTTTYDGLGRTLSVTPPGLTQAGVVYQYPTPVNGVLEAPYAVEMQILDTIAQRYRSVWGIYDGLGRTIQTQVYDDAEEELLLTTTKFNAQGLVWQQSLPYYASAAGGHYSYTGTPQYVVTAYDVLGRALTVTQPGDIISQTVYDGLTTSSIDPNSHKIVRTTDGLGRLTYVTEYDDADVAYAVTTYSNDHADRLDAVTDAHANVTDISYNWLGQKIGMDDPDMGMWDYEYYPLGNLYVQTDARGCITTFIYDNLGRVTDKDFSGTQGVCDDLTGVDYGYDPIGMKGARLTMTDASGATSWSYQDFGRTVTESRTPNELSAQSMITVSDWLGRPVSVTYPDSDVVTYHYDSLGRPLDIESSAQNDLTLAELAYNALGQIEIQTLGNGVTIENGYSPDTHRLESREATHGETPLLNLTYGYDDAGNITSLVDLLSGETQTHTYQYDFLNRLTSAEADDGTDTIYHQQFEYDQVGNILQVNNWITPTQVGQISHPEYAADARPAVDASAGSETLAEQGDGARAAAASQQEGVLQPVAYHIPPAPAPAGESRGGFFAPLLDEGDTPTPTATPTNTATPTRTSVPTNTPVSSFTPTASATPTFTASPDGYHKALLHMDGSDGSTTFTDATGLHAWTAGGNAQVDTAQFRFGGGSALFDGVGDYLSTTDHYDFYFGSGDFTIDFWVLFNSLPTPYNSAVLYSQPVNATNRILLGVYNNLGTYQIYMLMNNEPTGAVVSVYRDTSLSTNVWYHFAYVRNGNNYLMFKDGVQQGASAYDTDAWGNISSPVYLGSYSTSGSLNGWMDEVQVSKGIARWTSDFTPPPGPTAMPSSTPVASHTPTTTSTPDPAAGLKAYWSIDTASSLDGSTMFSDETGLHSWAANGSAQIDTAQSEFGGAAGLFDGNGDYITTSDSTDWRLDDGSDSNEWTIDFWLRFNGDPGAAEKGLMRHGQAEAYGNDWHLRLTGNNLRFQVDTPTSTIVTISNAWDPAGDTWYHVAIVKEGTTGYKMYIDGTQIGSTQTDTSTQPDFSGPLSIGMSVGLGTGGSYHNGWIDDVRISKGIARWTSNFTPPGASPSPDGYTKLLLDMDGIVAPDSAGADNTALLYSGVAVETTGASGKSLFFDGVNDYAFVADHAEIKNNGSFTLSTWINPASVVTDRTQYIVQKGGSNHDYGFLTISTQGTATPTANPGGGPANGSLVFQVGDLTPNRVYGPVLTPNTWTLVTGVYDAAAQRLRLYINDQLVANTAVTGTVSMSTTALTFSSSSTASVFYGGLDEVRFYSAALTGDQVDDLFGLGSPPTATPTLAATPVTSTPTHTAVPPVYGDLPWGTGGDGDLTVSSGVTRNINTQNQPGRTCADGGDGVAYRLIALGSSAAVLNVNPSSDCLNPGDEVMLINVQGTASSHYNTGNYEFLRVDHVTGNTVAFASQKTGFYGNAYRSDANIGTGSGQQRVMIVRVPNYEDVTVNGTLTGAAWSGSKNGVVAFRVSGTLSGDGTIHANALGYVGEETYVGSVMGYGAGWRALDGGNLERRGGAGAHGTNGEEGGAGWGPGGIAYGDPQLQKIFFGSGGGYTGEEGGNGRAPGGNGGGILWIAGHTIDFDGTLSSIGENSHAGTMSNGGGGAGGSVRIEGDDVTLATINAAGATYDSDGGAGRVAVYYVNSLGTLSSNPSAHTAQMGQEPTPTRTSTPINFATPSAWGSGHDGDLAVDTGVTFNLGTQNSNLRTCTDGGDAVSYAVVELTDSWAQLSAAPSVGCLNPGDEVLLVNVRGVSSNYLFGNTGNYEFLRVGGVAGDRLYFVAAKTKSYGENEGGDNNIGTGSGQQRVMVVRVPNYEDVTINGTLTGAGWSGSKDGVVAFRVEGTLSGTGTIHANALGFVGEETYVGSVPGYGSGWRSQEYPNNFRDGGGGAYGTDGQHIGGYGGIGGLAYGDAQLQKIFFGSGGGYTGSEGGNARAPGGTGGGILWIAGHTINFSGTLSSEGRDTFTGTMFNGGGGAGGTVRIEGYDVSVTTISVLGGDYYTYGGYGRIAIYYANSLTNSGTICAQTSTYCLNASAMPTSTATPTAPPDITDGDTKVLLSMNGADTSTAFTDMTGLRTWTASGNAQIDTGQSKFGGASGLFDGNGDYLSTADHDDFYFGTGDFTIDFWVRFNALPGGYAALYSQRTDGSNYAVLWLVNSSGTYCLGWNVMSGGAQVFSMCPVVTVSANTWYHVAFVRSGNTFRLFLNGVQQGYAVTDADSWPNLTGDATLGQVSSAYFLNGWLDEFRISKGVALWTTTFTPPGAISTATPTLTPSPTPTSLATAEWETRVYTYSTAIPHAVVEVDRGQSPVDSYEYDANGNMTCRVEDGVSFIQTYNAENRISSITRLDSGTCASPGSIGGLWEFKYDGDGVRTATDYTPYSGGYPGTTVTTTYYFGGLYEVTGEAVRKYYAIAGQTVAMDDGDGLKYFLTDHLGSVLAVVDDAGSVLSEQRYLPFGQLREDVGEITQTDLSYTGQRALDDQIGLMDYKARFYSPYLNRFQQPDSIVPELFDPQALNRFSYVVNNPINHVDPTGHQFLAAVEIGVVVLIGLLTFAATMAMLNPDIRANAAYSLQHMQDTVVAQMSPKANPNNERWKDHLPHENDLRVLEAQAEETAESSPLKSCGGKAALWCWLGLGVIAEAIRDALTCGTEETCESPQEDPALTERTAYETDPWCIANGPCIGGAPTAGQEEPDPWCVTNGPCIGAPGKTHQPPGAGYGLNPRSLEIWEKRIQQKGFE